MLNLYCWPHGGAIDAAIDAIVQSLRAKFYEPCVPCLMSLACIVFEIFDEKVLVHILNYVFLHLSHCGSVVLC